MTRRKMSKDDDGEESPLPLKSRRFPLCCVSICELLYCYTGRCKPVDSNIPANAAVDLSFRFTFRGVCSLCRSWLLSLAAMIGTEARVA